LINIEEKNEEGNTPLLEACKKNENLSVIQFLVKKGAKMDVCNNANLDAFGMSIIYYDIDNMLYFFSKKNPEKSHKLLSDVVEDMQKIVENFEKNKNKKDNEEQELIQKIVEN
jgi:hypothetical protein